MTEIAERFTKLCQVCGKEKAYHAFERARGGYRNRCRACRSAAKRALYWADPEKFREQKRTHRPIGVPRKPSPSLTPPYGLICYTAGLFDGEGCIHIQRKRGAPVTCLLSQGEGNNGEAHLNRLCAEWGVGKVVCNRKPKEPNRRPIYVWRIGAINEAGWFLEVLRAEMRIKQATADTALTYLRDLAGYGKPQATKPEQQRERDTE